MNFANFTGWDDDNQIELSNVNSIRPMDKFIRKPNGIYDDLLKNIKLIQSPKGLKNKSENTFPEIVSIYKSSKVSSQYQHIFEQRKSPISLKNKIKFPVINNKSLLSVYLLENTNKKNTRKKYIAKCTLFEDLKPRKGKVIKNINNTMVNRNTVESMYNSISPDIRQLVSLNQTALTSLNSLQ
jgi:hypothetical protein